jgi:hypothetical protein
MTEVKRVKSENVGLNFEIWGSSYGIPHLRAKGRA